MIADCETCDRNQVPCKSCQDSQRAICFICDGDSDPDPYGELEPTADEMEEWDHRRREKLARSLEY